uniref:Uncharacterized protein n=1 Tax=Fusarium oxysporum (strain Fo5176) TaxID=660025 RepID=A0A0D2YKV1_FUSOF
MRYQAPKNLILRKPALDLSLPMRMLPTQKTSTS